MLGHDPQREFDFTAVAWCPNGHAGEVLFYACSCCRDVYGECETCGEQVPWRLDGSESEWGSQVPDTPDAPTGVRGSVVSRGATEPRPVLRVVQDPDQGGGVIAAWEE